MKTIGDPLSYTRRVGCLVDESEQPRRVEVVGWAYVGGAVCVEHDDVAGLELRGSSFEMGVVDHAQERPRRADRDGGVAATDVDRQWMTAARHGQSSTKTGRIERGIDSGDERARTRVPHGAIE